MFQVPRRNFTAEYLKCTEPLDLLFDKASDALTRSNQTSLMRIIKEIEIQGDCVEDADRFHGDAGKWIEAGVVTSIHIVTPFIFMVVIWITIMVRIKRFSVEKMPLPPVAEIYGTILNYKKFQNEKSDRDETKWNEEKKIVSNIYKDEEEKIQKKLEENETILNIATMTESALEATFQVDILFLFHKNFHKFLIFNVNPNWNMGSLRIVCLK